MTSGAARGENRLAFAQRAYDHKRFAFASRLWAEASESRAQLGHNSPRPHRYRAACAAALAAAGQAQDEPPLDDKERAHLRKQALDWLRADLAQWTGQLESGQAVARTAVQKTMKQWQEDTDLASVRDAAALAKLPAKERAAFTTLWADVAALVKKAEEMGSSEVELIGWLSAAMRSLALARQRPKKISESVMGFLAGIRQVRWEPRTETY